MLSQYWFFHSIFEVLASVERLSPVDALNKLDIFYVLLAEHSIEIFQYWCRKLNIEAQSQKQNYTSSY